MHQKTRYVMRFVRTAYANFSAALK